MYAYLFILKSVKLWHCEKATQFEEISHLFCHLLSSVKTSGRFCKISCLFWSRDLFENLKWSQYHISTGYKGHNWILRWSFITFCGQKFSRFIFVIEIYTIITNDHLPSSIYNSNLLLVGYLKSFRTCLFLFRNVVLAFTITKYTYYRSLRIIFLSKCVFFA